MMDRFWPRWRLRQPPVNEKDRLSASRYEGAEAQGCMGSRVEYVPWQRMALRLEPLTQVEKTEVQTSRSNIQILGGILDGAKKRSDNEVTNVF
jgi:hypothetical protein